MNSQQGLQSQNFINGWVIAALFIHGFVIYGVGLNVQDLSGPEGVPSVILYGLQMLGGLVYFGMLVILLGLVRFGALLIIISGSAFLPIGVVAIYGGFKVLRELETSENPVNPLAQQETECETKLLGQSYGHQLPLGIVSLLGGLIVMVLGMATGLLFILIGAFNILVGISQKSSTVEFYPSYWKYKIALSGWRQMPYEDILDIRLKSRFLVIRYRNGEKEKSLALTLSLWGKEQVDRIHEVLQAKAVAMA